MKKLSNKENISNNLKEYKLNKEEIEYIKKIKIQLLSGACENALTCKCKYKIRVSKI